MEKGRGLAHLSVEEVKTPFVYEASERSPPSYHKSS